MLGRYRQPLTMSVLLFVSDVDGEPLASSPLAASLAKQSDSGWTLDPATAEPFATVLVDHRSSLERETVASLRAALEDHPEVDAVIGDAIVGGERQLRPAYSPTRLAGAPTELDLLAIRGHAPHGSLTARLDTISRLHPSVVAHLPAPLLHREDDDGNDSLTSDPATRLGTGRPPLTPIEQATFVIPTAGARHPDGRRLVEQAIQAAEGCGLPLVEILLVVGDEFDGDPADLERSGLRIIERGEPWNFSVAVNQGLLEAEHDTIVLLNDDIEMIEPGWARPLVTHLQDPEVALVGAALLYPDRTVQHIGIVIDDAVPLHAHAGARLDDLAPTLRNPREVAAVTAACAVGRRRNLLAVGGLNEGLPANFNDVDLCFKLQRTAGRIVIDPTIPLIHHESASREPVIEAWEWERFVSRWGEVIDPWYHPGHHRPDDPSDRRRNADGLAPSNPDGRWPLRTPTIRPQVHRARLQPPTNPSQG